MSNFKLKQQAEPTGILFGAARTMHNEGISVLVRGEHSVAVTIFVDMFRGTLLMRLKLSELKNLRDALNRAIQYMESKS
ncbi:MAG: hypothetical protein K2W95_15560 [Candidatus Obscuribacterales bacterium]|nr:hypothetical protein [Candidatus Obscuribacterales bacterium]